MKEIILEGWEKQLFLYAKNWYKQGEDVLKDLAIIQYHVTGMDRQYCDGRAAYSILCDLVVKYSDKRELGRFLHKLFDYGHIREKESIGERHVIKKLLLALSLMKVYCDEYSLVMGEPDIQELKKEEV